MGNITLCMIVSPMNFLENTHPHTLSKTFETLYSQFETCYLTARDSLPTIVSPTLRVLIKPVAPSLPQKDEAAADLQETLRTPHH